MMLRRLLPVALAFTATMLSAQSPFDIGARVAPQFHSYTIDAPSNLKISELSIPLFVVVPITSSFGFDVGTSWAQSRVEQTGTAQKSTSEISGFTDTQVRANYVIGNDFVVITAGLNLPSGKSTVPLSQQIAAGLIGNDFLAFPIASMGTGLGGTGGIALARPIGDWNLGMGLSMRRSAQYDPFDAAGGPALHYQPGNEYRARVGLDRGVGTGRFTVGLTYSTFGDDNLAGSIYNTGNRYLSQLSYNDTFGAGQLSISGWDLYRTSGNLAGGGALGSENITNGALAYGFINGSVIIEPNIEARAWTQQNASTSTLGTVGLRVQLPMGGMTVVPSAGYSVGKLASQTAAAVSTTSTLTGLHATLTIRLR
ncbi:MAG: hypothetical protein ABJF01_10745 [bacterium]